MNTDLADCSAQPPGQRTSQAIARVFVRKARVRAASVLAAVQCLAVLAMIPVLRDHGARPSLAVWAALAFAASQASLPCLMKRFGRVRHLTQVSVALGLGAAWIAALTVPDLRGAAMLWMALSPVWAGVTVGVPSAWRWVGVHGACAALLVGARLAGAQLGTLPTWGAAAVSALAVTVLAPSVCAMLLATNERLRAEAEEERARAMEDLRFANRQLAQARDSARAAERTKGVFLASMSHEIRTPMNAVIGMTGLLLDTPLDEVQRSYADTVRSSADGLLTIINDILDFSKIEAGRLELEITEFDLEQALSEGLRLFAEQARARRVNLTARVAQGVPSRVLGDPGRLRQVVLNLIGNAIKFTEHGTVHLEVSVQRGDLLRFVVQDTGVGIPADAIPRLFAPFSQADQSTTRRFGGTGLGLAICRQLVTLMEGTIAVNSEVGRGSSFAFTAKLPRADGATIAARATELTVHLPLTPLFVARRPVSKPTAAPRVTPPSARAAVPARPRVLVVEDNAVNQRVARALLAALGYEADVTANGREAAEAVARIAYAIVLMDVQMPVMDGLEATRLIRSREATGARVPIIALTADAMSSNRRACLDAGMDDFLSKPIQRQALAALLAQWCAPTRSAAAHG
jgi:signal transduction histidine kinase/CheY-like chemotaxis protein